MTLRAAAAVLIGATLLAACTTTTGPESALSSPAAPSSTTASAVEPAPTASPSPAPTPPPPLTPGNAQGRLIVVQAAEDAALVSGALPIRLTLARTGNQASWITAPPQKLTGTMTTEQAMLTLGWRPADDGTTAVLPNPRPNGLLAFAGGSLGFTVQRANVRADGTLVLDIRPMGAVPETIESYGAVVLTLDGAPGVLDFGSALGELAMRVTITGDRSEQAVIQVRDSAGEVLESTFASTGKTVVDNWLDVTSGSTTWVDPVVTFTPPERTTPGTVRVTGVLTVADVATPIDQVIARWSLPLAR